MPEKNSLQELSEILARQNEARYLMRMRAMAVIAQEKEKGMNSVLEPCTLSNV